MKTTTTWNTPVEQARAMQDLRRRADALRRAVTPSVAREMSELMQREPDLTPDQVAARAIVGLPDPGPFADDIDGMAALHFAFAHHPSDALFAAIHRATL